MGLVTTNARELASAPRPAPERLKEGRPPGAAEGADLQAPVAAALAPTPADSPAPVGACAPVLCAKDSEPSALQQPGQVSFQFSEFNFFHTLNGLSQLNLALRAFRLALFG